MRKVNKLITILSCLTLVSCGLFDEEIQEGARLPLDQVGNSPRKADPVHLGAVETRSWTQQLGNAAHETVNAKFDGGPELIGRYKLTEKNDFFSSNNPILRIFSRKSVYGATTPIIVNGRIYHYDSAGIIHAITPNGQRVWSKSLVPAGFDAGDGLGGGIAYNKGRIYVATGYGEVIALNASNGERLWTYVQKAPIVKAPVVSDGIVVTISEGANAVGLSEATGQVVWRHYSDPSKMPSRFNSGVPAARNGRVMLPFSSGAVALLNIQSGQVIWEKQSVTDLISGGKSVFADITGDPVFGANEIVLGTASGVLALSPQDGSLLWEQSIGTRGPLVVSGNSVFGVTQTDTVYRIAKKNGALAYRNPLPERFDNDFLMLRKRKYGDVRLIQDAVWVPSNKKELLRVDPNNGEVLNVFDVPARFSIAPVVAEGIMVAVTEGGEILIYR